MLHGKSRKVVVIRDIPSNVIEEAILVLKNDPGDSIASIKNIFSKNHVPVKNFLLKEAEQVINNYMKDNKLGSQQIVLNKDNKVKKNKINIFINIAMVASIVLLIFLLIKTL